MYQIGIDIGGTSIKIGLVDETLSIVRRGRLPFRCIGGENVAAEIAEEINNVLSPDLTISDIESIGVVLPGSIDKEQSTVLDAHNLDFHNVPFRKYLQNHFPDTPVYLANDADGAALAELGRGAFVGCQTAVLLTLGTGVGGGVIIGGKMFSGGTGRGIELGHMSLVNGGEPCTCGNPGCVEAYCSATGLIREGKRAMKHAPESALYAKSGGDENLIDAKFVIDCAKEGDPTAKQVVDTYLDHLAAACISVVHLLDPEVIAIGGGVSHAGDFLFEPLSKLVDKKCFFSSHTKVVPAVMGNDAGIIGAAMLYVNASK